ncbi:unnamed protein product, partial [Staurois parvus]
VGTGGWHWWAQVGGTGGHRWVALLGTGRWHCRVAQVGALLGTGGGTAGHRWGHCWEWVGGASGRTADRNLRGSLHRALIISALMIGADPRSDNCRFSQYFPHDLTA